MQAYRVVMILREDGTLTLEHLPFQPGEPVEIIILAQPPEGQSKNRYPLRGTHVKYIEPAEPVAQDDWEATQ